MEISIKEILLPALAIVISIVSLVRTRKMAELDTKMKNWQWRQNIFEKTVEIRSIITNSSLATQRYKLLLLEIEKLAKLNDKINPGYSFKEIIQNSFEKYKNITDKEDAIFEKARDVILEVQNYDKADIGVMKSLMQTKIELNDRLERMIGFEEVLKSQIEELKKVLSGSSGL